MRIRLWIMWGVAAVLGLAIAAVVIVTQLLDANVFRGQIETRVREATGRPFEIRGDLAIGWFPWLAIETGAAQLGNAAGVEGAPLIEWQSARVGAKLIPLLRGRLIIDGVRLQSPRISLRRTADGRANWDDLLAPSGEPKKERASPQIGGVQLRDGQLEYIDERSGTRLVVRDWQLDVGEWRPGEEVAISTAAAHIELRGRTLQLKLATHATLSVDSQQLDLRATELNGHVSGGSLPSAGVDAQLDVPALTARLSPLSLNAPALTARVAETEISASAQLAREGGESGSVRGTGSFSVQAPSLRKLLADLGVDAPLPRDPKAFGTLAFRSQWAYGDGAMAVKPIDMQIDETRLTGELNRSSADQAVWQFRLHGDRIDLARYVPEDDPEAEPFELPVAALRALPLRGELTIEQARFSDAAIKQMHLRIEHEAP